MTFSQVRAIVRRDLILFFRTSWYFLPLAIVLGLVMQFTIMGDVLKPELPLVYQQEILKGLLGYAPMMIIPYVGNLFLNKIMIEERTRQTLIRTMATGVNLGVLWWTKFLLAACISILTLFLSLGTLWGLIWVRTSTLLALTFSDSLILLVVNPILSLAVLAFVSYIYWALKKPSVALMVVPFILTFGSWFLATRNPQSTLFSPTVAWTTTLISAIVIGMCGVASSKLSRERISGLY